MNMKKLIIIMLTLACVCVSVSVNAQSVSENEYVIYVSPDGSDSNPGTAEKPLATLDGARQAVQNSQAFRKKPIRVVFAGGTYYIDKGVAFDHDDSTVKSAPISYEAAEGETVVFSGAKSIDASGFTLVTDENILKLLPETARGKVYQLHLPVEKYGKIEPFNDLTYYDNVSGEGAYISIFADGKEQMESQWPNGRFNYTTFGAIINVGLSRRDDNRNAKGPENAGIFQFLESNPKRWTTAKYARFSGYQNRTYENEEINIHKVDPENNTIQLKNPGWVRFSGNSMRRWKAFNLLEEIDVPSEWYLDVDTNILYYYPTEGFFKKRPHMEMTWLDDPMVVIKDVKNVSFKNIEFTKCRDNFMEIKNDSNIVVDGCGFTYGKRKGIVCSSAYKIRNCRFMYIDLNCLWINYGSKDLRHSVETCEIANNYFYNTGEKGAYLPHCIFFSYGSGYELKNNTFHNLPGGGVIGSMKEAKLTYNEFYNFVQQYSDMGAIYSGQTKDSPGKVIMNNFIYDYKSKSPQLLQQDAVLMQGIYMDDMQNYSTIKDNIFFDGQYASVMIGGGQYHCLENNIIVDMMATPISTDNRAEGWAKNSHYMNNYLGEGLKVAGSLEYLRQVPYAVNIPFSYAPPYGNRIANNISNQPFEFNSRVEELGDIENNITVDGYSQFEDPDALDFRLKEDSELGKKFPNLTKAQFNLQDVGCDLSVTENIDRSFELLAPGNGETGVEFKEKIFVWTCADMADKYHVTVAKDAEFKDVVYDGEVTYNWLKLDDLEFGGQTYYWKVTAMNTSFKRRAQWESESGVWSFTTSDGVKYAKSTIENMIKDINTQFIEKINKSDYDADCIYELESEIVKAESIIASDTTVDVVQAAYDKLSVAYEKAKNSRVFTIKKLDDKYFTDKSFWMPEDAQIKAENGVISFRKADSKTSAITLNELQGESDILQFRAKIDFNEEKSATWVSFDLRRQDTSKPCYSEKGYMLIVKDTQFEAQIYPGSSPIVFTLENNIVKDNEWHDYTLGAINYVDYVRYICAIDGKVLFDHKDYGKSVPSNGYFNAYISTAKGLELAASEKQLNFEDLEYSVEFPVAASAYTEIGSWTELPLDEAGMIFRQSKDANATAMWKFKPGEGMKKIFFMKKSADDGDAKAKLTVIYDYDYAGEGEEEYMTYDIDFTDGETDWYYIDTKDMKAKGEVTAVLSGSGSGKLYTSSIKCVKTDE